ncbi:MAG: (d)CMP kinase [Planctomycetota bacterium]|nr:(d)CMP kinase [Planctomycetota bacterium]
MTPSPDIPAASEPTRASVVTIDGPAGAGKSTVARAVADLLGFAHLDTGAMFRAVTWTLLEEPRAARLLEAGGDDVDALEAAARDVLAARRFGLDAEGAVTVDGRTPGAELRTPRVDACVSRIAALAAVRTPMLELQRAFAERGPMVCEGRDMGTEVFPDARYKFYLDASVAERARRRLGDYAERGRAAPVEEIEAEIAVRDRRDAERAIAPLRCADDAVRIDTTGLTIDGVVARIVARVRGVGEGAA